MEIARLHWLHINRALTPPSLRITADAKVKRFFRRVVASFAFEVALEDVSQAEIAGPAISII
jgi:hypothetical protein